MEGAWTVRSVVASNIARRRAATGMKVATLAAESGCSARTIHAVMRGTVGVGVRKLARIAGALDCALAGLLEHGGDLHVVAPPTFERVDVVRVLGRNIATLCWSRGFENLEALAVAAEISRSTIYEIVNATCDPSIDRVAQLGATCGVQPSWLLHEHAQRFPESCTRRLRA